MWVCVDACFYMQERGALGIFSFSCCEHKDFRERKIKRIALDLRGLFELQWLNQKSNVCILN